MRLQNDKKGRAPSLTPDQETRIMEMYDDGLSGNAMVPYLKAEGIVTTSATVCRVIRKHNADPTPKVYTTSGQPPNEWRSKASALRWGDAQWGAAVEGRRPPAPAYD
jgi:hypothetical protein